MERSARLPVLDGTPPFVKDFNRVIATLEQALAKRGRR
jgi:protein-tyrosine phosphatase